MAGGTILSDTWPSDLRIYAGRIVIHGFRQVHYARAMAGSELIVTRTEDCMRAALAGRWTPYE